uniref:Methenyltetrahydrofolate synthase domain-containing protein n=1 Tax=Strigamia maritima TaxID=126957 RepID=T1IMT5_STRMM
MLSGNDFIKFATSNDLITKRAIRETVWQYLEDRNIADFPRPVVNRIPNFKGAHEACAQISQLDQFKSAQTVKINPDKPQQHARYITLECGKNLLVPTPRLRNGLFNRIIPPDPRIKHILRECSTHKGVSEYSKPVSLNEKIKIDLIIIGSVAVSTQGLRIGKGEGYADLEYAMMRELGAVSAQTPIISVVHDCQIFDDLPRNLFGIHDVTVDLIVSPTRVIECDSKMANKPEGIIWSLLSPEKIKLIPILEKFRV